MHSRKRYVYKQKGTGGYSNGNNPNQEGGSYYQNGENPNQEGGLVNPRRRIRIRGVGQFGGARSKGSLSRQYAADALLSLAGNTPLRRPGTRGKTKNINNILNNMFNNSIERSPLQASTPNDSPMSNDGSPIGDFSPDYTLSDFSPVRVKAGKENRKPRRAASGRKRKRTAMDNENLLMVKQFKIANPTTKVNDLHALSGGWKLHGSKLGEERKGYRAACLRMGALLGEKMYSSPNSVWMDKMRNGEPFDLLQEYNKLKKSPMATSTNVVAAAVADTIANTVTTKSRSKRKNLRVLLSVLEEVTEQEKLQSCLVEEEIRKEDFYLC